MAHLWTDTDDDDFYVASVAENSVHGNHVPHRTRTTQLTSEFNNQAYELLPFNSLEMCWLKNV